MSTVPNARAAALLRYVDLFLHEIESRRRDLDARECEHLAEMFVRLSVRNYDCEDVMRQLEFLLAADLTMRGKQVTAARPAADIPSIAEYRTLLRLVRGGV